MHFVRIRYNCRTKHDKKNKTALVKKTVKSYEKVYDPFINTRIDVSYKCDPVSLGFLYITHRHDREGQLVCDVINGGLILFYVWTLINHHEAVGELCDGGRGLAKFPP